MVIIEHNMDVIKIAYHILDLGPERRDTEGEYSQEEHQKK